MKICIVTPYANPEKGAAIVRVNSFQKYFSNAGHEVIILAPKRVHLSKQNDVIRFSSFIDLLTKLWNMKFDVILGTSPPIPAVFLCSIICKLKNRPLILDSKDIYSHTAPAIGLVNENSLKFRLHKLLERLTHEYANRILVLDPEIGNWIQEKYHIKKEKIVLAPNGVDTDAIYYDREKGKTIRKKLNIPDSAPVIAYVGGLGDEKYIEFLRENTSVIKKNKAIVLFVIASDESPRAIQQLEEINATVKELEIQNSFRLVKNIPHSDIYQYLSAASVGVDFLSKVTLFAVTVKILEYLAVGLPVVVKTPSNNKSYELFFSQKQIGFGSTDWKSFALNLDRLLRNKNTWQKNRNERTNMIKNYYTRRLTNQRVLETLKDLVG